MGGADYLDSRDRGWVRNSAGHRDTKAYIELLADRLVVLISREDNPQAAMAEIAEAAEHGGLIDSYNLPRHDDAFVFSLDLLLENPIAGDWLNARLEYMPHPFDMAEIADVAEHLL